MGTYNLAVVKVGLVLHLDQVKKADLMTGNDIGAAAARAHWRWLLHGRRGVVRDRSDIPCSAHGLDTGLSVSVEGWVARERRRRQLARLELIAQINNFATVDIK